MRGEPRVLKPKPKHPVKVHVWVGISRQGATQICIFIGVLDAINYCNMLEPTLIPFTNSIFPNNNYRFQQDNDPKHTRTYAQQFYIPKGINWWKTPAESPDLNPIENVWASLKYYLRNEHKLKNLETLEQGIKDFWKLMTPDRCTKYVSHLNKVMPVVILKNGEASGF